MRTWQDGDEIYVQRGGGPVCHQYAETPIVLSSSAVELVPHAQVVDEVRRELLAIQGLSTAARRAIGHVLDRAAGGAP